MSKKVVLIFGLVLFFLFPFNYFELEENNRSMNESVIGLTINGSSTTAFPSKESGLAIGSIICDKEANGVWDYDNWTLKIRNVTESRTKCQVNFVSQYRESILNGTDPVLKDGLIPVKILDDGTVTKASLGSEWYKYEERQWANAVILNHETEVYYDGDIIPEESIESYFVWIPRYKYKIWNLGIYNELSGVDYSQVHTIDIVFGTETTTDSANSCKTSNASGASGNCSVGKYMTHPAFISFNINGMWVGKFETGYKGATITSEAEKNENNSSKIQIKPNVYSWRNIQPSNSFSTSFSYHRDMNSHLMKNTEWGAVAYLSHSNYGSYNKSYINNSNYITGVAGWEDGSDNYLWNTEIGVKASTTGNISGIYDMSGGAWEHVMGVMMNQEGIACSGRDENNNSGFNGPFSNNSGFKIDGMDFPKDSRYYDLYIYDNNDVISNRRILGDATGEMGPFEMNPYRVPIGSWYDDGAWFIGTESPWFCRGGRNNSQLNAGIFNFFHIFGNNYSDNGFRIVLT